jgi:protocatechuate 3,4-dioxygenase beta subunit
MSAGPARVLIAALVAAAAAGASGEEAGGGAGSAGKLSISGRVVDGRGEPVGGARVTALPEMPCRLPADVGRQCLSDLRDFCPERVASVLSAADGRFVIEGLDAAFFRLRVVAPGFGPEEGARLHPPESGVLLALTRPGSRLGGRVRGASGEAVAGARLMAYRAHKDDFIRRLFEGCLPPIEEQTSDGEGAFTFEALGEDLYSFAVEAGGYAELEVYHLEVAAGENPERTFTLEPGTVIRGRVLDPDGGPLPGAKVAASPVHTRRGCGGRGPIRPCVERGSAVSGPDGGFSFDTLEPGTYRVTASHPQYVRDGRRGVQSGEELVLRLGRGVILAGRVLEVAGGRPMDGASVSAEDRSGSKKTARSDSRGGYLLEGLDDAWESAWVEVKAQGYAGQSRLLSLAARDLLEEDFHLLPSAVVSGRVLDHEGRPVRGAVAAVLAEDARAPGGRLVRSARSDADGRYEVEEVEAGEAFHVHLAARGFFGGRSSSFRLAPGARLEVPDVVLIASGVLAGRVVDSEGNPVAGAKVAAHGAGGLGLACFTAPDGRFRLEGLDDSRHSLLVETGFHLETRLPGFTIPKGETVDAGDIALEPGRQLSGRVVDREGRPLAGATVRAFQLAAGLRSRAAKTGIDGRFAFGGLLETGIDFDVRLAGYRASTLRLPAPRSEEVEVVLEPRPASGASGR